MAKTRKQKDLLSEVKNSTLAYNYDLTRVDPREYAAPISAIFQSQIWKDMFIRRNTLFRAAQNGDANAFKQIEQIDRKVALILLQGMFQYSQHRQNAIDGRTVSLNEYFDDFVRTKGQRELFNSFSLNLDCAMVLADILESFLLDAKETLVKLDPSLVLQEFDAINNATKILRDFTHIHHRDMHPTLDSMFADNAEETEEYLRMKTALFVEKYKAKRAELVSGGELAAGGKKKHSDREYLTDLCSNYFYVRDKKKNGADAQQKARALVQSVSDEEIEAFMPVAVELYNASQQIHMADERITTQMRNLPDSELSRKILNGFEPEKLFK